MKLAAQPLVDNPKTLRGPLVKHLLLILLLGTAGLGYLATQRFPAPFNVDEIHYLLATQRLVEERSFNFDNGFDSFRSHSLLFLHPFPIAALPTQERLTTFVPPVHTLLAAPFYAVGKRTGIFLLSALCALGSLILVALLSARLARRVTTLENFRFAEGEGIKAEAEALWFGAVLFAFGAYFAEYSYSLLNHSTALLLTLIAVSLHPLWLFDKENSSTLKRQVFWRSLLCGFAIGLAFATRLQHVVLIVALGGGLLLVPHGFLRALAGYTIGVIPPVALLSAFNKARFGAWNPIAYGIPGESSYAGPLGFLLDQPILIIDAALLLGGVLFAVRSFILFGSLGAHKTAGFTTRNNKIPMLALAVPFITIALIALLPMFSRFFSERVLGFRFQEIGQDEYWRGHTLGIWSGPRKALLQSFPLAIVAFLAPIWFFVQGHAHRPRRDETPPNGAFVVLTLLAGAISANLLLVLLLENNGGFFFNQRYLIEAVALSLPIMATLLVTVRRHPDFLNKKERESLSIGEKGEFRSSQAGIILLILGSMLAGGYVSWYLSATGTNAYIQSYLERAKVDNLFDRSVPMFVGMVIALCFVFDILLGLVDYALKRHQNSDNEARSPFLRAGWLILFPLATLVAGWNHMSYDLPASNQYRESRHLYAAEISQHIPDGSVVAAYGGVREPVSVLKEDRDIWVIDAFREGWPAALKLMREIAEQHPEREYFLLPGPLTQQQRDEHLHKYFQHMNLRSKKLMYRLKLREAQMADAPPLAAWAPSHGKLSD